MLDGILPIIRVGNGCDYHRVFLPLQNMGYDFEKHFASPGVKTFEGVSMVYFNRVPLNNIDQVLKHKRKYNFKLVVDIDDWWMLNTNHLIYKYWKRDKMAERIVQCLEAADLVTCTTNRLATKVRPHNKNVHVLPNALPFGVDQFTDEKVESDGPCRYIYAGGSTHFWDVKVLENPFKKIIHDRIPGKFILAGYSADNHKDTQVWDKIETAFMGKKLLNYQRKYSLSIDTYMNHYSDSDVSLVPLEDNIFTPYKSNLKIVEAGCKNIPVIVSDLPPYNDDFNPELCMYASSTRDWYNHIKYCSNNPSFVKEAGLRLGEFVREHYNLSKINNERRQLFEHTINC